MYEFYDLNNLPKFDFTRRTMQVASYDRKYENADFAQFLYVDGEEYVLFDETVKGCIKSIWMAVTSDETHLHFYFDGEKTARWNTTSKGLFTGGIPELSRVGNTYEIRGHYEEDDCHAGNCFVEIPYEKGLKITLTGNTRLYYHIMYESYFDGGVHTVSSGGEYLEKAFAGNRAEPECETVVIDRDLKVGYTTPYETETAGVIRKMRISVPKDADISELYMDMCFDKRRSSQVGCPLSYLFAEPLGAADINAYAVKTEISGDMRVMTSYFPIPWWESLVFCIVNWSDSPIHAKIELWIDENTYDRENTGYFFADFYKGKTQLFGDWLLGDFFGRGKVVGLTQTCIGGQYCEGNEHFYINGEKSPTFNGTGTEDLYLGCYWPNFKYDSPLAGCVNDVYLENGSTLGGALETPAGYYRHFLDMPINFENGIKLYIQHGAVCQTYSDYSSVCFSYRRDEPSLYESDHIDLESDAAREMHSYKNDGEYYIHTGKTESDMRSAPITHGGYKTSGEVTFTVAIRENNKGAVIRRLYDKGVSNKGAEVYIDGTFAGVWNTPGVNEYFTVSDDDFYIPEILTKGKKSITVRIKADGCYTDLEYKVFSRI